MVCNDTRGSIQTHGHNIHTITLYVVPDNVPGRSPGSEVELSQLSSSHNEVSALPMGSSSSLSVELDTFADNVTTPNAVLEGIWKKARELVGDPHKLVPAPGCSPLARMVASKTSKGPHLVTPGKDGRFACNSDLSLIHI